MEGGAKHLEQYTSAARDDVAKANSIGFGVHHSATFGGSRPRVNKIVFGLEPRGTPMLRRCAATLLTIFLAVVTGAAQGSRNHSIIPLKRIPQKSGGFEVVSGDPNKSGVPYVIRISNDSGFVVPPHTHPEDENIVVIEGSWTVAMGRRVNRAALQPMEVGAYAWVPKKMAHFGWSKTATVIQVHGIGPFSTDFVDPPLRAQ